MGLPVITLGVAPWGTAAFRAVLLAFRYPEEHYGGVTMGNQSKITKRVSVGFTYSKQQEYEKLIAIADNEGRRLSNLIEFWIIKCVNAYEHTDSKGSAYIRIRYNRFDLPKDSKENMPCKILAFPKAMTQKGGA